MAPDTGIQLPVISQFYQIMAILLFLVLDGHLLIIQLLVESFKTFPIGEFGFHQKGLWEIVLWAGRLLTPLPLENPPISDVGPV